MLEVRSENWVGANQRKRRGKSMCDTSGGKIMVDTETKEGQCGWS